ncbi:MAG: SCO6880 family protein [Actinomycetota bacterium]
MRTYRLPDPDRTGWLLGLGPERVVPGAAGLVVGVLVLVDSGSVLLAAVPVVVGIGLGSIRPGGRPLTEVIPAAVGFVLRRRHRRFSAPLVPQSGATSVLPHPLDRHEFLQGDTADGQPVAIAVDRRGGAAAATLRLCAPTPFLLASDAEQERLVAAFGDALGSLHRERSRVLHLRWTSFAAAQAPRPYGGSGPAALAMGEVNRAVADVAVQEVLLTLVLGSGRREEDERLVARVAGTVDRFAERLSNAGFDARPLDSAGLAAALRQRLDPAASPARRQHRSLAELAALVTPADAGPSGLKEDWDGLRVDGTHHRAYRVLSWPRGAVQAEWMGDLLLTLPPPRSVCVLFEPVPPFSSRRAIEREAARLDSDAEQRRRSGFRVGADHDAAREALASREAEFTAGHPEVVTAGLVILSAGSSEELDEREAEAFSAAAAAGVELAPWSGCHGLGFALSLPVAFTPDPGTSR